MKKCNNVTEIHVATTNEIQDEVIYNTAIDWGFKSSKGSEHDVLDRFYNAVKNKNEWIRLLELIKMFDTVDIKWVKAHNGNENNERVDTLAREYAYLFSKKE